MRTITFMGIEVEYDETKMKSWRVQRMLATAGKDMASAYKAYDAIDIVLCGKADEVADKLGDSADMMNQLLTAITEEVGGEAKN